MIWPYLLNLLIFIVSCLFLVRSGLWVVKSLIKMAQFLGWREFIVSSVLMAFSTSLPEIFIGITSAFSGMPRLSFGDVIGSNIIALTLVIGIGAILADGITFRRKFLQRASIYAGLYALLPLLLMLDRDISREDGIILFFALVFYFLQLLSEEERFTKVFSNHFTNDWPRVKALFKNLFLFFAGVAILLISAQGIVYSASQLADLFHFPLVIIGTILVALGTSLPELVFGIRSITLGHKQLILGDVMGSVVINSTLVLGLTAMISPFKINDFSPYFKGTIFTLATCLFFVFFARTDRKLTKKEAIFLVGIYALFVFAEVFLK